MAASPVRVLIAEDSPLFSEVLARAIGADGTLSVIGIAQNGLEAVRMVEALHPDVVTMDVLMPVMQGLEAIEEIMARYPTPILVLTADPRGDSGQLGFEALRRGALDVWAKPDKWHDAEGHAALRRHLHLLASVPVLRHARRSAAGAGSQQRPRALASSDPAGPGAGRAPGRADPPVARGRASRPSPPTSPRSMPAGGRIVGVVASTGGPAALSHLLGGLPASFGAPILVVQHLAPGFTARLASWLDGLSPLAVREARNGEIPEPGVVLLAPDERHLVVDASGRVALEPGELVGGHRPSGTVLLASLSRVAGAAAVGVVLTGMGRDGVEGLRAIREAGGDTLTQDEASSLIYGMPKVAWESGAAERVVALAEIGSTLAALVGDRRARRSEVQP